MSNRLLTRAEFRAWCEEIANKVNEDLKTMKPEERKKYVAGINEFARKLGAFPMETDKP